MASTAFHTFSNTTTQATQQVFDLFDGLNLSSWYLTALPLLLAVTFLSIRGTSSNHTSKIRDANGDQIREVAGDARIRKFADSTNLSQSGKDLAGDNPYILQNGVHREMVLTSPDHVRDFYKGDKEGHRKPRNINMGNYFGLFMSDAVGAIHGERWKVVRKHFEPEFSFLAVRRGFNLMNKSILSWCNTLPRDPHSESCGNDAFLVDVRKAVNMMAFEVMAQQLYGEVLDEKAYSDLLKLSAMHEPIMHDILLNSPLYTRWGFGKTEAHKRALVYAKQWAAFNDGLIADARRNAVDCPAERIYRGVDGAHEMTKKEFLHTMDEIIFGNIDLNAGVISTMFSKLATAPAVLQTLLDEIKTYKPDNDEALASYISNQNTILHRVVMESMRFSPATAFGLPEFTSKPKNIGGFQVPANTACIIDVTRLNADPATWGPTSQDFCPARFETLSAAKCRYQLMRFGVGANTGRCLGKNYADAIFKSTAVAVLTRYGISEAEKKEEDGNVVAGLVRFTLLR